MNHNSHHPFLKKILEGLKWLGIIFLAVSCFSTLISVSSLLLKETEQNSYLGIIIPLASIGVYFLFISLLYIRKIKSQYKVWGISKGFNFSSFLLYAGIASGIIFGTSLIVYLSKSGSFSYEGMDTYDFLLGLSFFIFIAFVEEFTFRMFIFSFFRKRFSTWKAIIITSVIFGFYHIVTPGISALAIFNLFLVGVLFNMAYSATGSIYIPIIMHFLWNYIQGPLLGFDVSGLVLDNWFQMNMTQENLINGGAYGMEGSLATTALLLLSCLLLYKYYPQRKSASSLPKK